MCDFLSFLVHERGDRLPLSKRYLFGDLASHSGTAEAHGVKYGDPDVWREVEWTSDAENQLVVRATDRQTSQMLKATVLGDFSTRAKAIAYAVTQIPSSVTVIR